MLYIHWPTLGKLWTRKAAYLPLKAAVLRRIRTLGRSQNVRLVTCSRYTAAQVEMVLSLRPVVIHPPVNVERIPFREGGREPDAITVGRFSREKRFEVTVRMVPYVKSLRRLYVCGMLQDRTHYEGVKRLVEEFTSTPTPLSYAVRYFVHLGCNGRHRSQKSRRSASFKACVRRLLMLLLLGTFNHYGASWGSG